MRTKNKMAKKKIIVKKRYVKTEMTAYLSLPKFLTTNPEKVAVTIFRIYQKKRNIIYVLGIWR